MYRASKHLSISSSEFGTRPEHSLPTLFVRPPQEVLRCPICHALLSDAVISTRCGHTFCFKCVCPTPRNSVNFPSTHQPSSLVPTLPIATTGLCPLDQVLFQSADLIPNRAIRDQVSSLPIHCCHGVREISPSSDAGEGERYMVDEEGCPEEVELGKRDQHETECLFAQIQCSNSTLCGLYRKKDMDVHLRSCAYTMCCYTPFGCNFVGCPSAVETHESVCVNRSESGIACVKELTDLKSRQNDLSNRMEDLTSAVKNLQSSFCSQLEQQNRQLICLSVRVDAIETQLGRFLYGNISDRRNSSVPFLDQEESKRPEGQYSSARNGEWLMPFTLKCVGTFQGHKGNITSLVSSPGYLVSGATDGQIKLWNATDPTRGCHKTTEAHGTAISTLAVEGTTLFSAGRDLSLCAWQLPGMELICRKEAAHNEEVSAMVLVGAILVTAVSDTLKMWQLEGGELVEVKVIPDLPHKVRALTYDRRREFLYSGAHNTIHVWQAQNRFPLRNKIESMGFSSIYSLATTAQFLVVGTYNQNIQVLDIGTYQHYRTLTGHIGTVTCLLTTPHDHGQFVFSGSQDTTVQLWNLENMLPVQSFQRHETPVTGLALHNDWFFSASEEKEIKVFKRVKS